MADKTVRGRFVWHELATPDTAAAHTFYSKALGWKTEPYAEDPSYSMFAASSGPLGGTTTLESGQPNWLPYIGTPDIEKTVSEAVSRGGAIKKEITSMGGSGGRYAILTDPQGAAFGVYSSPADPGRDVPAKRGEYSWHELATTDSKGAVEFYSSLFGWQQSAEHDMGPMGIYRLFGRNGRDLGGIFNKMAGQPGPAWLGYVRVKSVDPIVKKVKSAGGKLINGPMEVPGGDWIAQFLDPHGAMFAVHALKADVDAAKAPAAAASQPQPAAPAAPAPASEPAKAPAKKAAPRKPAAKVKSAPAKAKRPAAKAAKAPAKASKKKAGKKKAAKKAAKKSVKKSAKKSVKKTAKKKARKAK